MSMKQMKCPKCGESNFEILSGNTYKCLIDGSIFKDDEMQELIKRMEEQSENYIGNLRFRLREETNREIIDTATVERLADSILDQDPYDVVARYFKAFCRRFKDRNGYKAAIEELSGEEVKRYQAKQIAKTMIRFYELYVKDSIVDFLKATGVYDDFAADLKKREDLYEKDYEIKLPTIRRDVLIICDQADYADAQSIVAYLESKGLKCWFEPRNYDTDSVKSRFMEQVVNSTRAALFINSENAKRNLELNNLMYEVANKQNRRNECYRVILSPESVALTEDEFSVKAIICRPEDGLKNVIDALKRDGRREEELKKISKMIKDGMFGKARAVIEEKMYDAKNKDEEKFLREKLLQTFIGDHSLDDAEAKTNTKRLKALCTEDEIAELEEKYPSIIDAEKIRNDAKQLLDENKVDEAVVLLKKATQKNDAIAYYTLGDLYFRGRVVPKDIDKAVEYYNSAAKQGHAEANRVLGFLYEQGRFVPQNKTKAFEYYLQGAKLGQSFCCFKTAEYYASEQFSESDEQKAFTWYREAAKKGELKAVTPLGLCYKYGKGAPVNMSNAKKCFEYAATKNDPDAKRELFGH